MRFRWSGSDPAGMPAAGVLEAYDAAAAQAQLQAAGSRVDELRPAGAWASQLPGLRASDLAACCDQLAGLVAIDMPLPAALAACARDCRSGRLRHTLDELAAAAADGRSMEQALAAHHHRLPDLLAALLAAGERSGRLDDILRYAALHYWRLSELQSQVRHILAYPAILIALGTTVFAMVAASLYPQLRSKLVGRHGWFSLATVLVLLGAGILLWRWLGRSRRLLRPRRWLLYRMPLLGNYMRAIFLERFARSLALFLRSGVGLPEAIALITRMDDRGSLPVDVDRLQHACSAGVQLSDALGGYSRYIPAMDIAIIRTGESHGDLPAALEEMAAAEDVVARRELALLQAILPVLCFLVVGLVFFYLIRQLMAPLFAAVADL
ncbi:MAG: type II secretion system F family protein [Planctomycetota bacterium]